MYILDRLYTLMSLQNYYVNLAHSSITYDFITHKIYDTVLNWHIIFHLEDQRHL